MLEQIPFIAATDLSNSGSKNLILFENTLLLLLKLSFSIKNKSIIIFSGSKNGTPYLGVKGSLGLVS